MQFNRESKMKLVIFCGLILISIIALVDSRQQWLTARGRARCGLGAAADVASPIFIKLIDRDTGKSVYRFRSQSIRPECLLT